MVLNMKSLILLAIFAYAVNAQDDVFDSPDDSDALQVCVINGMEGRCVESNRYCSTVNHGDGRIIWRLAAAPCKVGICCKLADVLTGSSGSADVTVPPPLAGLGTSGSNPVPPASGSGTPGTSGNTFGGSGSSAGSSGTSGTFGNNPGGSGNTFGGSGSSPGTSGTSGTFGNNPGGSGNTFGGSGSSPGSSSTSATFGNNPGGSGIPGSSIGSGTPGAGGEIPTTGCGIKKIQNLNNFSKTKPNQADPGEFPWAVTLLVVLPPVNNKKTFKYTGTGALIHKSVVLTAAHVLNDNDLDNLRVMAGEYSQTQKILRKKLLSVTEVVKHENFNSGNGDYDFALAFLKGSALTLPHVGTVCLPPASYVPASGTSCQFSGWGVDSQQQAQQQLTKTVVPMMSHSACQDRFRQSPKLGPGFQLLPSLTCAGGEVGKDLCGGGGGSPLVCPVENEPGRFMQTGVVSWVIGACGVDGYPVAFANVALARPWIDQQMASHSYTAESYTY